MTDLFDLTVSNGCYGVYKVTAASIGTTKKGYEVYRLQLNNSFWATKLVPSRQTSRASCKLYQLYTKNKVSLDSLVDKYIYIYLIKSNFGVEFGDIGSFDVLQDFKKALDASKGKVFVINMPIYDFLLNMKRTVESDGSIKLSTDFGDMRISKVGGVNICYQYNESNGYLNLRNIKQIFDKFYKDVTLPPYSNEATKNSYYIISLRELGIARVDHHVISTDRVSSKGDCDKLVSKAFLKIGDKLSEEQVYFLKNNPAP